SGWKSRYAQPTMNPAWGPRARATYVYRPPADGISLASWPIDTATHVQPTSASSTDSGRAGPANWIEIRIENAIAAPGAMCVIDWNRTCGRPIDSSRKWSKEPASARAAMSPPLPAPVESMLSNLKPARQAVQESILELSPRAAG